MAEISPPPWMQQGTFPALNDRQSFAALLGSEGVVNATAGAGDLRVTERAAGANMSVDVSSGRGWVLGDSTAFQGFYVVANDANVNLAVAASDATNPRKDIVIAEVRDAFYAGASNDWQLRVVTGSPAASPAEPALPDTALKLAVVDVAAGATSITNANITDTRAQARTRRQMIVSTRNSLVLLTDDSVAATSTWEQWGTEEVTFENPGHDVSVIAHLSGHVTGENTSRVVHECRLQVSLDGGSSWNTGRENRGETDRNGANIQNVDQSVVHVHSGPPTGQIQIRAQIQQILGTAGGSGWRRGQIAASMSPVVP